MEKAINPYGSAVAMTLMFVMLTTRASSDTARYVRVPQIYKTLGQGITALRRKSNMTQQQLADAVGISRASVANIERGEQRVFLDQAVAIASLFDLNGLDELMSAAHAEPLPAAEIKLSGDRLNRAQRREVSELLEELLAENEQA